jgi:glycosyltransferase involved in cell wall biosynthesis
MRQVFLLNGFAPERIHLIPYFVETPPESAPVPPSPGVLFAGRLVPEKGVDRLLHALAQMGSPPKLLVAGDGPERSRLARLAQRLGVADRTEFLGWLSPAQVGAIVDRVSVVAVPSLWPEPFGIIGIEAMAHGRPVVAFDVGGIREWLQHEVTGLLVPPEDVPALSGALAALFGNPDCAWQMGEAGRRAALTRFSAGHHVSALLNLFAATRAKRENCTAS